MSSVNCNEKDDAKSVRNSVHGDTYRHNPTCMDLSRGNVLRYHVHSVWVILSKTAIPFVPAPRRKK
jgi:hypothetical protein